MWRKDYRSKNSVRRWWWKHEEKLVAVSSPSVHSRFHYPDKAAITADYLVFKMIYICYTRQDFERRAPRKNLGLMVKNFNSCRTCGKHSHNLQKLSHWISSTHNITIRSPSCSSINHWEMDWIGWQIFGISGCYFQCWRTANLCGILWRARYIDFCCSRLFIFCSVSRQSSIENCLVPTRSQFGSSQKRRRSASPDVSSAKRRNISSSSEISPERPKPKAAVKLTPPPDSPSTPASLSGLRRMVRDDHGVSWTDYEVRKLFTLNHIWNTYNTYNMVRDLHLNRAYGLAVSKSYQVNF